MINDHRHYGFCGLVVCIATGVTVIAKSYLAAHCRYSVHSMQLWLYDLYGLTYGHITVYRVVRGNVHYDFKIISMHGGWSVGRLHGEAGHLYHRDACFRDEVCVCVCVCTWVWAVVSSLIS